MEVPGPAARCGPGADSDRRPELSGDTSVRARARDEIMLTILPMVPNGVNRTRLEGTSLTAGKGPGPGVSESPQWFW